MSANVFSLSDNPSSHEDLKAVRIGKDSPLGTVFFLIAEWPSTAVLVNNLAAHSPID